MQRQSESWDEVTCWLCDYGWILLVFVVVLIAGWYARDLWVPVPAQPPVNGTPIVPVTTASPASTSTAAVIVPGTTSRPATATPLPTVSLTVVTETPALPQYIIVLVPLNWQGDRASFEAAAQREIAYFSTESDIGRYFTLQTKLLDENMTDANLDSDTLLYDMVEFAAQREPADRYVGLTDGNIVLDGESSIAGWTMGPNSLGVMGEADADYVVAHELGHTFGLCDEYNYGIWQEQNQEFQDGCPNLFPTQCDRIETSEVSCEGTPTEDGRNSIMGPAGLPGSYGFNAPSFEHLLKVFAELSHLD